MTINEGAVTAEELAHKAAKGHRYAAEPDRFTIEGAEVSMRSEHGHRVMTFESARWRCTCEFFQRAGTCSHLMALHELLDSARLTTAPRETHGQ